MEEIGVHEVGEDIGGTQVIVDKDYVLGEGIW